MPSIQDDSCLCTQAIAVPSSLLIIGPSTHRLGPCYGRICLSDPSELGELGKVGPYCGISRILRDVKPSHAASGSFCLTCHQSVRGGRSSGTFCRQLKEESEGAGHQMSARKHGSRANFDLSGGVLANYDADSQRHVVFLFKSCKM